MEQNELLQTMEGLANVYLNYLFKTKTFDWLHEDQKMDVQKVVDVLMPGSVVDVNCDACLSNALAIIQSRYEVMSQRKLVDIDITDIRPEVIESSKKKKKK